MTTAPYATARSHELLPPGTRHGRLWVTDEPVDDPSLYLACVAAFPTTGFWPVLVPPDPRFAATGEDWIVDRPWLPPSDVGRITDADVVATLRAGWQRPCCDGNCLTPFDAEFPGLARRSPAKADPFAEAGNTGTVLANRSGTRLALVDAERPADIPAVLGWRGTVAQTDDLAGVSAVLRSWEERFGAVVVGLGFDTLELSVASPPKTRERALATAAEHRAFCHSSFVRQPGTLREFANDLKGRRLWSFWWDWD